MESLPRSSGVALVGPRSRAYDEEAFRYLLEVERKRVARSQGSFLLLLVKLKNTGGLNGQINQVVAARIFTGLWLSLREADFVGWFRDERVAGAVLTQDAEPPVADVSRRIGERVIETLTAHLPWDLACRLHVRVLQFPSPQNS